jgi:protocatechuate 3,4-dioxygenase beta subunit
VVVPPGTPPDEHVEIAARVLTLDDGPGYAAAMGEDGRFAVMFPKDADSGWIEIHARYLLLGADEAVDLVEPPREVLLEPILGGRVLGRVMAVGKDAGDFRAPPGTFVELSASTSPESTRFPSRRRSVGEDRRFEFEALPPISGYEIAMKAKGFLPFEKKLSIAPGTTTEVEIALHSGVRVSGRVLDADGKPVDGAVAWETEHPSREAPRRADANAVSEPDGAFAMTAIPPGDVSISFKADGRLREIVEVGRLEDGDVRTGLEVRLRSSLVQGRVEWPDGSPAFDAVVELSPAAESGNESPVPWDRPMRLPVHDAGRFSIEAMTEGPFFLFARSPGELYLRRRAASTDGKCGTALVEGVRPSAAPVVLVLEPGLIVHGRVIDDRGDPVRAFAVNCVRASTSQPFFPGGYVGERFEDPEGLFTLSGLSRGPWRFTARVGERTSVAKPVVELPNASAPIVLVVSRGVSISGTVVDPAGLPVVGAKVESVHVVRNPLEPRRWESVRGLASGRTDDRGAFELTGLPAGHIDLWARSASAASSEPVSLLLQPGESIPGVRLALRPGGTVACEVRDAEGRPEPRRRVAIQRPDGTSLRSIADPNDESDEEGHLVLQDLPPGPFSLVKVPTPQETDAKRVQGPNLWTRFAASTTQVPVDVVAGEVTRVVLGGPKGSPIRVRGRVIDDGVPVPGIRVAAKDATPSTTDAQGRFELTFPDPGNRTLTLDSRDSGFAHWTCRRILADSSEALDLILPHGEISGLVRGPDDRPVEGAVVGITIGELGESLNTWRTIGRTRTDASGRFSLRNLPPGRGELMTSEKNGEEADAVVRTEAILGDDTRIRDLVIRLP